MASTPTLFKAAPHYLLTIKPNGGTLLNLQTSKIYCVNHVATRLWALVAESQEGLTSDAIMQGLSPRFENYVPIERLQNTVGVILTEMEHAGLLERCEAVATPTSAII